MKGRPELPVKRSLYRKYIWGERVGGANTLILSFPTLSAEAMAKSPPYNTDVACVLHTVSALSSVPPDTDRVPQWCWWSWGCWSTRGWHSAYPAWVIAGVRVVVPVNGSVPAL